MMNFVAMKWINVDDLGDKVLFLWCKGHSIMKKLGKWGYLSKFMYYL